MSPKQIEIKTDDGAGRAFEFRPDGAGPWPAAILYMDGIGIRPAILDMGERLAKAGYFVLLPDLFWRAGPYEPMNAKTVFTDPEQRKILMSKFIGATTVANVMKDTRAFLDHLAAQRDVKPGPVGVTGYCMGGRMSLCAAGTYPEHVGAAASFHGGTIANDAPDSPHLLASKMKARVFIAQSENDPADQTAKIDQALKDAGVTNTVETWPAKHGWVPTDTPVHDPAQAERHWTELQKLFGQTLR